MTTASGSFSNKVNKIIENYRSESDRHRERLDELQNQRESNDDVTNSTRSSTSSTKSIMITRTLQESLTETKITKLKRRRQNARLQINNIKKLSFENEDARDDTNSYCSTSTFLNNSVEFDRICVREYEVVCGDNPSVLNGPPISIGWKNDLHYDGTIEAYEKKRMESRNPFAIKLPSHVRRELLSSHGHSDIEIESCARKATVDRKKRIQTIDQYEMNPNLHENLERIGRVLTSPFRRRQKKAEKKLWKQVQKFSS